MPEHLIVVDPVLHMMTSIRYLSQVIDTGMLVECMGPMNEKKLASLRRFLKASEELMAALYELQAHVRSHEGMQQ